MIENRTTRDYGSVASLSQSNTENKSAFCKRAIVILRDVTAFISGVIFFPLVGVRSAYFEYRYQTEEESPRAEVFFSTLRAFLYSLPGGFIVYGISRIIYNINPTSPLGVSPATSLEELAIQIPIVGPGVCNVLLNNAG